MRRNAAIVFTTTNEPPFRLFKGAKRTVIDIDFAQRGNPGVHADRRKGRRIRPNENRFRAPSHSLILLRRRRDRFKVRAIHLRNRATRQIPDYIRRFQLVEMAADGLKNITPANRISQPENRPCKTGSDFNVRHRGVGTGVIHLSPILLHLAPADVTALSQQLQIFLPRQYHGTPTHDL